IAHFAEERYREARDAARRAIETNSDTPWGALAIGWQDLAASLAWLGETEEAAAALAKAIELRPDLSPEWVEVWYASADPDHRRRYLEGLLRAGLEPSHEAR
ncbi:MAG: hypothetical protein R3190_14770, partial [Thermoanaerobaculia bacterium]|nr:hypothetical protein [Thermoanaerobaculia bacterium]